MVRPWVLVVAVATLAALALAPSGPAVGDGGLLQGADCLASEGACPAVPAADPLGADAPALGSDVAAAKSPRILDRVGGWIEAGATEAGRLAARAYAGLVSGALALAAGLTAALQAYVGLLISLKPASMATPAFAVLAAAWTAAASAWLFEGLRVLARRLAPLVALLPGFSRIAKDELLEHERRARIYEMIRANPGSRLTEVTRGLDLAWGTALHHLRKLRADRLITIKYAGRHKCYFINGSGLSEVEMRAASVLKGDTMQGVASYIGTHPRTSLKELAAGLGISNPLASFHVDKLAREGIVEKVRDGRSVRLALRAQAGSAFPLVAAIPAASPPLGPAA